MPYKEPQRKGDKYVLPKEGGGVHSTPGGKPVLYKSKASAKAASRAIMASENKK